MRQRQIQSKKIIPVKMSVLLEELPHISRKCKTLPMRKDG